MANTVVIKNKEDEYAEITNRHIHTTDLYTNIAKGVVSGHTSVFKFGRNSAIASTEEVVWDYGGDYTFLTSAGTVSIVSTSTNDTSNGTGARTLVIYGLDSDFNEQSELIVMNGTTPVVSTKSYRRLNRALVLTSGTDSPIVDANVGTITISVGGTVQAQILPRNGQTLMAVYTVPAGKTAYVTGIGLSTPEGKSILIKAKIRNAEQDSNGSFSIKYTLDSYQQAITQSLAVPLRVPEKTDMCFTALSSTGVSTPVSASFGLLLVDN